jgi:hypothetical protein
VVVVGVAGAFVLAEEAAGSFEGVTVGAFVLVVSGAPQAAIAEIPIARATVRKNKRVWDFIFRFPRSIVVKSTSNNSPRIRALIISFYAGPGQQRREKKGLAELPGPLNYRTSLKDRA